MQLLQPLTFLHVGLAPGERFGVLRIDDLYVQSIVLQHLKQRHPVHAGGLHHHRLDPTRDQPLGQTMEIGGETAKLLHRAWVASRGHGYIVLSAAHVDTRRIEIQNRQSFGRIRRQALLLLVGSTHILASPK